MHLGHPENTGKGRGALTKTIPVLAGPTGAGKTNLIASMDPDRFEIVSLDSRQIYKHLSIGTAAPDARILRRIPHHLVGFLDPDQSFTAMEYRELALEAIQDILSRKRIPLMAGGAGFYLQVLMTGPFEFEEDPGIVEQVRSMSPEERLTLLSRKDPHCIVHPGEQPGEGRIHPNDAYRVERYLIMVLTSGMTMSELWTRKRKEESEQEFDFAGFFLFPGEETLWKNLRIRAETMVRDGLIQEAVECRERFGSNCPGLQILGYPEALACADGKLSEEELVEKLWIVHRQYARRQRIWFQKRQYVRFVDSLDVHTLETAAANLFSGLGINH
ncbi:MAG TPA: tRNA (adenosine(37)-N6)-dimethylallyltransferase MiaA [Leptospiraceae bacterium]|nr:tRNA (adenosine(37)-N6)-dimethylallyltransferase MiaA [Spirochaetaceae bacterium]HBS04174.1 tRNA (adenosine(37)-N6)-dimethylallyltransferase MiaA [Leptospiraceae bacterium]